MVERAFCLGIPGCLYVIGLGYEAEEMILIRCMAERDSVIG